MIMICVHLQGLADDIKGQCASPGSSNSPAMIQLEPLLLRTTLVAALRALFEVCADMRAVCVLPNCMQRVVYWLG
jgi:hypothetical protein